MVMAIVAAACSGGAGSLPASGSHPVLFSPSPMSPVVQPIAVTGLWCAAPVNAACKYRPGPIDIPSGDYMVSWELYNPDGGRLPLLLGVQNRGDATQWLHQWQPVTSQGEAMFSSAGGRYSIVIEIDPNPYAPTTWTITFTKLLY